MKNLLTATTRNQLREWLTLNAEIETEAWIYATQKVETGKVLYLDIVEEALCFGWIDSTKKKLEDGTVQRISPRKKNSNWTELNKERVRRLEKLGLMAVKGRECLPDMSEDSFVLLPEVLEALQADCQVWENYQQLPCLYKRVRIDTIQFCLKLNQRDLFEKRLQKFIDNTRENQIYGAWNDDGLLLGY